VEQTQEKIEIGSLVGLTKNHEDPDIKKHLDTWVEEYGARGPFRVHSKTDVPPQFALQETRGEQKVVRLGFIEDPFLPMSCVELWREL
jgi:hypothetical protein